MKFKGLSSSLLLAAALVGYGCTNSKQITEEPQVSFNRFEYESQDKIFSAPLPEGQFQNPILAGFYPDPGITRAGDYYYLVHSSFSPIPYRLTAPKAPKPASISEPFTGNFIWRDEFTSPQLRTHWNLLRISDQGFYTLDTNAGTISLKARLTSLADLAQPAFIGRRQQHMQYLASTQLQLPQTEGVSAGLVAFQSEQSHYYLGIERNQKNYQVFLEQANKSRAVAIKNLTIPRNLLSDSIILGIEGNEGKISFYYQTKDGKKVVVADNIDGKLLSTAVAGGFVGTYLSLHARSESGSIK